MYYLFLNFQVSHVCNIFVVDQFHIFIFINIITVTLKKSMLIISIRECTGGVTCNGYEYSWIRIEMVSFDQGEGWRWGWTLKSDCREVSPWTRHKSNCLVSTHMSGHRKESIPHRWRNWTYRRRVAARRPGRCSRLWPWSWASPRSCRLHCEQTLQCNCDDAQPLRRPNVTLVNRYTRVTVTSLTQSNKQLSFKRLMFSVSSQYYKPKFLNNSFIFHCKLNFVPDTIL